MTSMVVIADDITIIPFVRHAVASLEEVQEAGAMELLRIIAQIPQKAVISVGADHG